MLGTRKISVQNRLLAAIPRSEYRKLLPTLEEVELSFQQVLYEPDAPIRFVYFPIDCFVSMLTAVDSGRVAEVGLVGLEGMVGIPVVLGSSASPFRAVVQGGGKAMRMNLKDFRRAFRENAGLRSELFLFTHLLMIQIAQTAACNRFHKVTQRMARWLLMTRDRVNADEFRMTQEFLGLMLGVRRVGISVAGRALQERKLVNYRRGTITILDQKGLLAASCGCYKTVKDRYTRGRS